MPVASSAWLLGAATPAATAAAWKGDSQWHASAETDDNYSLRADGADRVSSATFGGSIAASRETEASTTRVDLAADYSRRSANAGDRAWDGRIAIAQTLRYERNVLSAAASAAADSTANAAFGSADLLLGRGRRVVRDVSLGWTHRQSERLDLQLSIARSRAAYDRLLTGAINYAESDLSAGATYRLSETDSSTVSFGRTQYRPDGGGSSSTTESLKFNVSHAFSEVSSASLGVGTYRIRREATAVGIVCPLTLTQCQAGIVPFVAVLLPLTARNSGNSFSANFETRLDEKTGSSARISRDLSGSGAGLVRTDAFSLRVERTWSPTLSGSASFNETRTATLLAGASEVPRQRTFSLDFTRALSSDTSLRFGFDLRAAGVAGPGSGATSRHFFVTLQGTGPRALR